MTGVHRLRRWLAVGAAGLATAIATPHPAPAQPAPGGAGAGAAAAAPTPAGPLVVPAGTTTGDGLVVLRGDVAVFGTVRGDVAAVTGDVVVHPGARVDGDVVSVLGRVRVLDGGAVTGEARSFARDRAPWAGADAEAIAPAPTPLRSLTLTVGWLVILLLIGVGVLVSGSTYLDGVAAALERGPTRALFAGLVGQLLLLPTLVTGVVLLAVTILGILAIPLAVVAFVLATAGLLTLGFLGVAFVTGRAMGGGRRDARATAARGEALRALTIGLLAYFVLWLAAAALQGSPTMALVLRAAALAVTWVAGTAGFGAALLSRAGTRTPGRAAAAASAVGTVPVERNGVPVWQTPTPVSGIVAARHPTPAPQRPE